MLEATDAVVILVLGLAGIVAGHKVFRSKFEAEKAKQLRYAKQFTPKAKRAPATQENDVADWVKELIEGLGHSTDELYEDEMPEDLAALIESPLAQSFLKGAAEKVQGGQQQPDMAGWE